jgi:hypothetical protein
MLDGLTGLTEAVSLLALAMVTHGMANGDDLADNFERASEAADRQNRPVSKSILDSVADAARAAAAQMKGDTLV